MVGSTPGLASYKDFGLYLGLGPSVDQVEWTRGERNRAGRLTKKEDTIPKALSILATTP
jgi:hypothetical protein